MQKLIDLEPLRSGRARFIASFNRGYCLRGTLHCTVATEAISRYMKEGETLSRDIASRYGN